MSLLEKLKKNSRLSGTDVLADSKIFSTKDSILTDIPAINIALSGELESGLSSGLLTLAGESKRFKSMYLLFLAGTYLKAYPESVFIFYDSEFGASLDYFASFGIDTNRVLHCPLKNIEDFKLDIINQLESLEKGTRVFIGLDSLGNLASKKEIDDALENKSVADMGRSKQIKSCFRMITPYLTLNNIPMVVVNHTYKTQTMYSTDVVSGGTGIYYSSQAIWIIGRQQDQEKGDDGKNTLNGYNFIINIEKSRFVKEKSKIAIQVSFNGGIEKYSGLLDLALEGGFIVKPKVGWYQVCDPVTKVPLQGSLREADTYTAAVWDPLLKSKEFKEFVKNKFKLAQVKMIQDDIIDDEV